MSLDDPPVASIAYCHGTRNYVAKRESVQTVGTRENLDSMKCIEEYNLVQQYIVTNGIRDI